MGATCAKDSGNSRHGESDDSSDEGRDPNFTGVGINDPKGAGGRKARRAARETGIQKEKNRRDRALVQAVLQQANPQALANSSNTPKDAAAADASKKPAVKKTPAPAPAPAAAAAAPAAPAPLPERDSIPIQQIVVRSVLEGYDDDNANKKKQRDAAKADVPAALTQEPSSTHTGGPRNTVLVVTTPAVVAAPSNAIVAVPGASSSSSAAPQPTAAAAAPAGWVQPEDKKQFFFMGDE